MGQLVIKFRAMDSGTNDLCIGVNISSEQKREIKDLVVREIILDGTVFIPSEPKRDDTTNGRAD